MQVAGFKARLCCRRLNPSGASDYIQNLMDDLTQQQIEELTPSEYSMYLAYGSLLEFDDDEITEESIARFNRIYDI